MSSLLLVSGEMKWESGIGRWDSGSFWLALGLMNAGLVVRGATLGPFVVVSGFLVIGWFCSGDSESESSSSMTMVSRLAITQY